MPQIMKSLAIATGMLLTLALPYAASAAPLPTEEALEDRVLGDPNAPVTILDYSSLTCPHCATFHNTTLAQLKKDYIDTGKAKLVFRDFPFDGAALRASQLTRCAPKERYWGLLDLFFQKQEQWSRATDPVAALGKLAKLAGLSQSDIDACIANERLADGILAIRQEGEQRYKIESTPTFVLNEGKETISGAQPLDVFAKAIDKLAKK